MPVRHSRLGLSLLAFMLIAALAAGAPAQGSPVNADPDFEAHVPDQLLVGFRRPVDASGRSVVHRRRGAEVIKHFEEIQVDLVRIAPGLSVTSAARSYFLEPSVRFAEPNFHRRAFAVTPNDPAFGEQWGLRNIGQTVNGDVGTADADIDASEPGSSADGWQVTVGSTSTVVAVIDTGVDIGHEDLSENIWTNLGEIPGNGIDDDGNGYVDDVNGWDFAHNDASVYDPAEVCGPRPNDDHGTHVAGIVGAVGNNSVGVSGVNWRVQIMPLKFLGKVGGQCGEGDDAGAIEAILYAARMGAQIINVSWGGPEVAEGLRQAFIAAGRAGIPFAAAAGNTRKDLALSPEYPPNFDLENEIVVAASDNDDALASFSNFGGPTHLAAPGVNILSTLPGNLYAYLSGTSMAAPFVTGALALLRSQYPEAPAAELKARILETVDAKPAFSSTTRSGGRLNVNAALRQVRPVVPTLNAPNGGEVFAPGFPTSLSWNTNIPPGNAVGAYRLEFTTSGRRAKTLSDGFETGMPTDFAEPVDSDLPWLVQAGNVHAGTFSARAGVVGNSQASWLSTTRTFSVPGTVTFWYRLSSENCETPETPVCGDYLRFFIDGVPVLEEAGEIGWTRASLRIPAGTHTLSWAYQKDALCPGPEPQCAGVNADDAAWIDDIAFWGIDDVPWSLLAVTPSGATSYTWTVPGVRTNQARIRICPDTSNPCLAEAADESDGAFAIGAGGFVLDGFGALHPFAVEGFPAPTRLGGGPYFADFDIARSFAPLPNGSGGYMLDGFGGRHRVGEAPPSSGGPYFQGFDIANDLVLRSDSGGGYVLDGFGAVHPFAVGGNPAPPAITAGPYFPGFDIARSVVLLPDGSGGYVLDGFGGIHPFAIGDNPAPLGVTSGPYFPGFDIARSFVLLPNGSGGYVLDGFGAIHPFAIGGNPAPPAVTTGPYFPGFDIANELLLAPDGLAGYVLHGFGAVPRFTIGSNPLPPAVTAAPSFSFDIARALAG